MSRNSAIQEAVKRVEAKGATECVVRRGDIYKTQPASWPINRGWVVAEMIGPGNVHNFKGA